MNIIETNHLTKYYGKARGIIDSNLTVCEGDIFGFIGPNGAGKSTTIRLLLGMIYPTKGNSFIFGKDCAKHGVKIREEIGYMPSEAQFYSQLRVEEAILLAAKLHNKDCREEASSLCERFQVDTKKKIEDLSLGNRKKVSIVCAMQHKPKLLILDEPTSGLDPLMQKEFFRVLHERNAEGATIFLSSHVLPEIQQHCNQAAIIKEGKIIRCGNVDELVRSNAKRVSISGIHALEGLENMFDVKEIEQGINFLYRGDMPTLLGACQGKPITDMTITEPSLEEMFLHFYEKEEA